MITLHFEKLYSLQRNNVPVSVCIPFKKGSLKNVSSLSVLNNKKETVISQAKATGLWDDGSIKFAHVTFAATLPSNKACDYYLDSNASGKASLKPLAEENDECIFINTGALNVQIAKKSNQLFDLISYNKRHINANELSGPHLIDKYGRNYVNQLDSVTVIENGPVYTSISYSGHHSYGGEKIYPFNIILTLYAGKSYMDIQYRITNATNQQLQIQSLKFNYLPKDTSFDATTRIGISNYKTNITTATAKEKIELEINPEYIKNEALEHFPETFGGTFWGDYTDEISGMCATIYQAKQNYPKTIVIDKNGLSVLLVPQCPSKVILQPGMARSQRLMFNFHSADTSTDELDNISTIYQMPDMASLDSDVYKESGIFDSIFTDNYNFTIENYLTQNCDIHGVALGMMSWGDYPDMHYTAQGRGNGQAIWCNNEYDFPHACMLQYIRTGQRRFLDYMLVSARHQMEVDVCHFSDNPLHFEGMWQHCTSHSVNGLVSCSHQWVEGLLDYYHITGDKYAYDTAIGIGNNVLRLLETDEFKVPGASSARETGWALRTLTALFIETNDKKWLEKCDWIVSHFDEWTKEYGAWLSPYTSNTAIRVPFMTSVAVGSLMRYYRAKPSDKIKTMIINAVDDMLENCILANGLFFYKELPSLKRNGTNPLVLEALAIAYELTDDIRYLSAGIPTLKLITAQYPTKTTGSKELVDDSILIPGKSPKNFAQSMLPITKFYALASNNNLIDNI